MRKNSLMEECRNRYVDTKSFLTTFSPQKQYVYCLHKDRCFCGNAPSLSVVSNCFGNETARLFVSAQIKDLMEYSGCKDKLTVTQIDAVSRVIVSQFYYLKTTEIMYFFYMFKGGHFGSFYGAVDTMIITKSLHEFLKFRNDTIDIIERKRKQDEFLQNKESYSSNAITYEEWVKKRGNY